MDGQHISVFTHSIRVGRRLLKSRFIKSLSFLIFGMYCCQSAYAEPDAFPQASASYSSKKFYTNDAATLVTAMSATLKALSIPVVSVQNQTITTDYLEGPTIPSGLEKNKLSHTRYKYEIRVLPPLFGHILVNISATIEASTAPQPGAPFGPWHNVTLFCLSQSSMVRGYLSEAFETTLNGGQVKASAQVQTLSASSSASPAASSGAVAGSSAVAAGASAPLGNPLLNGSSAGGTSNFDAGLGASGDVGGGANTAAAPVKTSLATTRSH